MLQRSSRGRLMNEMTHERREGRRVARGDGVPAHLPTSSVLKSFAPQRSYRLSSAFGAGLALHLRMGADLSRGPVGPLVACPIPLRAGGECWRSGYFTRHPTVPPAARSRRRLGPGPSLRLGMRRVLGEKWGRQQQIISSRVFCVCGGGRAAPGRDPRARARRLPGRPRRLTDLGRTTRLCLPARLT
jgi:hypothetical protein